MAHRVQYVIGGEKIPYTFDDQERIILRELVRNPRISDNQIGKKTGIPVKTVNRKRKKLEENGVLNYMTRIDHTEDGTGQLPARQLHMITFVAGITRKTGLDAFKAEPLNEVMIKHVYTLGFGEQQGRLMLIYVIESYQQKDLLEIFNAEIVPWIHRHFGSESIKDVHVVDIASEQRIMHNYLPGVNLNKGKIKEDWPDDGIFVD